MIPLHDVEPARGQPIVTRVLILVNVLVWLYVLSLADQPRALEAFYGRWSFDPFALRDAIAAGNVTFAVLAPLITHQFLQAGWLHLLGNMLYLWIFGDNVEGRLGSGRFLIFYLVSGVIAAAAQAVVAPAQMVGASGAIAGVLGAYLVTSPTAGVRTLVFLGIFITVVTLPAWLVIGEWLLVQVLSGLESMRLPATATGNVAYVAHVGGALAGAVLVWVLRPGPSRSRPRGW